MINNQVLGRPPRPGEIPVCKECGKCCYFREDHSEPKPCPWLGKDNLCEIHEARPRMCRKWFCLEAYEYGRLVRGHDRTDLAIK